MFSWIQTSAVLWDHKRKLLSRIHVVSVSDLHLPCNIPVLQMQSWGTVKLKPAFLPPFSMWKSDLNGSLKCCISWAVSQPWGKNLQRTESHYCLYLREAGRQRRGSEFWKALNADQKRESSCLYWHSLYKHECNPRKWETRIYYLWIVLTPKF